MLKQYTRALAAALLLSLLAACGPTGGQSASTAVTPAAVGNAATTEPVGEATTPSEIQAAETVTPAEGMATSEATTAAGAETTAAAAGTGSEGAAADYSSLAGEVIIDGSSTVEPISLAVAEEFRQLAPNVDVAVGRSGTGGGFEKFCNGETDISDASRPIRDTEAEKCTANNIEPVELQVGIDVLALVTSSANTFLTCLTGEQIVKVFQEGGAKNWNEVDASFPNEPIQIFAPGADSGTFDYFVEHFKLRGAEEDEPAFLGNFTASEDDNVLVQGIAGSRNSIGFFGFSYYQEKRSGLKAIALDQEGNGTCVEPSAETVSDNSYPLARPLFIYPSKASLEKPQVRAFVEYYLSDEGLQMVEEVDYFPAPEETITQARGSIAQTAQ